MITGDPIVVQIIAHQNTHIKGGFTYLILIQLLLVVCVSVLILIDGASYGGIKKLSAGSAGLKVSHVVRGEHLIVHTLYTRESETGKKESEPCYISRKCK